MDKDLKELLAQMSSSCTEEDLKSLPKHIAQCVETVNKKIVLVQNNIDDDISKQWNDLKLLLDSQKEGFNREVDNILGQVNAYSTDVINHVHELSRLQTLVDNINSSIQELKSINKDRQINCTDHASRIKSLEDRFNATTQHATVIVNKFDEIIEQMKKMKALSSSTPGHPIPGDSPVISWFRNIALRKNIVLKIAGIVGIFYAAVKLANLAAKNAPLIETITK
jgi:uncharacterized protein YoxC